MIFENLIHIWIN